MTFFLALFFAGSATLSAQPTISNVRDVTTSGTFQSLNTGELTMIDADGKPQTFKIQSGTEDTMSVADGQISLNAQAQILVTGRVLLPALQPGMVVSIDSEVGLQSKTGKTSSLALLPLGSPMDEIKFAGDHPTGRQMVPATIVGTVMEVKSDELTVAVPQHRVAPHQKLSFKLDGMDSVPFKAGTLENVSEGDVITHLRATELSTGELIAREINIETVNLIENYKLAIDQQLALKFWQLSDEPMAPRDLRSQSFLLKTDMSERRAAILLEKLETMVSLVSDYYGKSTRIPIPCIVIEDLARWDTSQLDARVLNKVRNGEGMTAYRRIGRNQEAIVYSAARDGVVQHEAVHAFCFLTFGDTGPLWYSEGMAEMGEYWQPGDLSVQAHPVVIGYLTASQLQPLQSILIADRIEGEAWKAYAWRWAICHLLAGNPNYSRQFKRLGLDLMTRGRSTFESTFGNVAREISFEYEQFLKHLRNGYRVDLCAWDWNRRAKKLGRNNRALQRVVAARGWQATSVLVERGQRYAIEADGSWQINSAGGLVSADGMDSGDGRLLGVIMLDYQLSDPIELGSQMEFTAPSDGQLYLRCRESFEQIGDNQGEISVTIKKVVQ